MRTLILPFFLLLTLKLSAQSHPQNLIIITTDGFRWQDLFGGMDTAIANKAQFNEDDSVFLYNKYGGATAEIRRQKLLPFLWTEVAAQGVVFGNRWQGSKVDNANPYWFSYPGYSEIMTGFADTAINSNAYPPNPNTNLLEFFNRRKGMKGKVAAFGAWDAFDRILNEARSNFPVISAFDTVPNTGKNSNFQLINAMQKDGYRPWDDEECLDVFTHFKAMEYLKTKRPRILYIAYGETDEWAHSGKYRSYLDAAHQVDAWIRDIWNWVQQDPQYRNNTALFITTDHGRGDIIKEQWTSHNNKIADSHEIWFAAMGPGIVHGGENKLPRQFWQQQFAQTLAHLMGYEFDPGHPVALPITQILE